MPLSLLSNLKDSGLLTPILGVDVILFLIAIYLAKTLIFPAITLYSKSKQLDRLIGTTPKEWFFGHAKQCQANEKGMLNIIRRTLTFPTMVSHWLGPFLSVVVMHHSDTAAAFLNSKAPKDEMTYKFLRPWLGDGLLTSKGEKWRRNRRLLTPAFHFSVLKGYTEIFNGSAEVMLQKWEKSLRKPLDVLGDVSLMTLDSMLKCAMSTETNCQNTRGKHPYIQAVRDMAEAISVRLDKPFMLLDFIFWRTKYGKRFKKAADVVHTHAEKVIKERRLIIEKSTSDRDQSKAATQNDILEDFSYGGKKRLDFLDILLQTRDELGNGLTDGEIRDEVDTFMFEGHDTTASGISWAMYNLAKYPEFQQKCREEVVLVMGTRKSVEWNDLAQFHYLTMFLKESMRVHTPVPAIGRLFEKPLEVKSSLNAPQARTIPEKTTTILTIFSLHRNETLWENPEVFDPERFTKENIASRPSYAYLPFSAGSRNCIGQNFAMNEMKIVLAQTLRRYRLYLDSETPRPEMIPRLVLQSANGIILKLEKVQ